MTAPTIPVQRPAPGHDHEPMWTLVERAQAGDREAWDGIWRQYHDGVFRFVYFRVGSRPLAEDLTGDVFAKAIARIGSVTYQGRDLGAWLYTVARHRVADHFKSGWYRIEMTVDDIHQTAEVPDVHTPESIVGEYLRNRELLAAVLELTPEQREAITLRFFAGLSVTETAAAMGKEDGAVKALQYRACNALRKLVPELEAAR